jgi:hypothetical protein
MMQSEINFSLENIAAMIANDGAREAYFAASESTRIEMLEAYQGQVLKNVERMQATYLTSPAARESLIKTVHGLLVP